MLIPDSRIVNFKRAIRLVNRYLLMKDGVSYLQQGLGIDDTDVLPAGIIHDHVVIGSFFSDVQRQLQADQKAAMERQRRRGKKRSGR